MKIKLKKIDDSGSENKGKDEKSKKRGIEIEELKLIKKSEEDNREGGKERMENGNGEEIEVDIVVRNIERMNIEKEKRGEGLVKIEKINVRNINIGMFKKILSKIEREGKNKRRLRKDIGKRKNERERIDIEGIERINGEEEKKRREIKDERRIEGMVEMVEGLDLRVRMNEERIEEKNLERNKEGRDKMEKRMNVGEGENMIVKVENGEEVMVIDSDERIIEIEILKRIGREIMDLERIGIEIIEDEKVFGGNKVGGKEMRNEIEGEEKRWVNVKGEERNENEEERNDLKEERNKKIIRKEWKIGRGKIDGIKERREEERNMDERRIEIIKGIERRRKRNEREWLEERIEEEENNVIEIGGVDEVEVEKGLKKIREKKKGRKLVKGEVIIEEKERSEKVIVNIRIRNVW